MFPAPGNLFTPHIMTPLPRYYSTNSFLYSFVAFFLLVPNVFSCPHGSSLVQNQTPIMSFSQTSELQAWQQLQEHYTTAKSFVLKDLFAQDPQRFEKFSRKFKNDADGSETLFDFSKNFLTEETLKLLVQLAKEAGVEKLRDEMFRGEKINFTEKRAVYHVALRNTSNKPMTVDGKSVLNDVNSVLEHVKEFSEQVRSGAWKGHTGKPIKSIVNVGIGGSDLYCAFHLRCQLPRILLTIISLGVL